MSHAEALAIVEMTAAELTKVADARAALARKRGQLRAERRRLELLVREHERR